MTELSIVPECYVDTKVVEIIAKAKRKFNHQHGCGDVANQLKNKLRNKTALGIIDEDKGKVPQAKYFFEFEVIKEENNLIFKKHRERKQYLILICPEIEKWLMKDAEMVNINPLAFNLPEGLSGFKEITKRQNIDRNHDFYRFIKKLINENAPSISTLKDWIEQFIKNELRD